MGLNIYACLLVMFLSAWFGLVLGSTVTVWRYSMYLFIYSLCASLSWVALLVSEQHGQDILITAGKLKTMHYFIN